MIGQSGNLPFSTPLALAVSQGLMAAFFSAGLRSARWWIPIHMLFMPCVVLAAGSGLPPWAYLGGFVFLALVYWSSFRTQVPLFLSNKQTVHRLAAWLPDNQPLTALDIGSGTGSLVLRLAQLRPDWQVHGIETAPAPYWLSRRLCRDIPNTHLSRGDFWQGSLQGFDVVYAFLSPVPMPALWAKAVREMRPGSWLISNSFEISRATPEHVISVRDKRNTHLFCYRIPGHATTPKSRQ
ncbi:class I SAM-dependent methyltransferase [Uliginosibacterium sp. H3]|uniref:Class I SAM-dependent methyltransferase n=1 Tax=Uliginosibacterium silvisoli TaxID=3114758 RepID=A0ABU6JY81_9RHOO|nr:class I SAM-dependent methyltransferase [Uliginosibacterium sp. H3]